MMIIMSGGSRHSVLLAGEHSQGRFAVVETRERQGAEPPRHVHSLEDEFVYVLEGRVTFDRDGERFERPSGTWLFLPRGSEHTFSVKSPEARLLVLLSPAGLEHCLPETVQSDEPSDESQVIERLVATAARYGVSITGPAREFSGRRQGIDSRPSSRLDRLSE